MFDPAQRPAPQELLRLVLKYMKQPVADGSDELRMRLDDQYNIGKKYRSSSPQPNDHPDSFGPLK